MTGETFSDPNREAVGVEPITSSSPESIVPTPEPEPEPEPDPEPEAEPEE